LADTSTLNYLAHLLDSGVAPLEASMRLIEVCPQEKTAITQLIKNLKLGHTFASSVNQAGSSSDLEYKILKVAEQAGKATSALRFISSNRLRRQKRSRDLHSRLLLPNAVILIMLTVYIIRSITTAEQIGSALITAITIIALSISITYLLLSLAHNDATYWLSLGWRLGLQKSSKRFSCYSDYYFYTLFYWHTNAGIDYITSAKILSTLYRADAYQTSISSYQQGLNNGKSVSDALFDADLLAPGELRQIIRTGEKSGRLPQALQHYLSIDQLQIDESIDSVSTWIPRIYYTVIMLLGIMAL
jgi:type II secretory pathway component PulF